MPDDKQELSNKELQARWESPQGKKFRDEIIKQLQSEETGHTVNWGKLKIVDEGKEVPWRDFPGVSEIDNERDLRGINLEEEELIEAGLERTDLRRPTWKEHVS